MDTPGSRSDPPAPQPAHVADAPEAAPSPDTLTDRVIADRRRARRTARGRRAAIHLSTLLGGLLVWWAVTAFDLIDPLYLPSPGAVADAFVEANSCRPASAGSERVLCGEQNYYMWEHLIASLQRIAVGVGAAAVLGPVVGFLMGTVRWLGIALEPYLNFLRAIPPLGYIGLLIVWFGIGDLSKNWLLFLAAFPPIVIATINGIRGLQQDRVQAALSLGANRRQVAAQVVLPSALPDIINGLRIATGFAWTTVVAAELNAGIPGIGGLAYVSGTQLKTGLTIACIIVIGLCAVALDALIKYIGTVLVPWHGRA